MKSIKILLVEDDPLDVINIKRNLDKLDIHYSVQVARNGEEGLAILHEKRDKSDFPDVILVDINMPRMNGFEFLKRVKDDQQMKHLKCFIISSSDQHIDKEAAKILDISGYIVKPLKLNNPKSLDAFNLMIDLLNF